MKRWDGLVTREQAQTVEKEQEMEEECWLGRTFSIASDCSDFSSLVKNLDLFSNAAECIFILSRYPFN